MRTENEAAMTEEQEIYQKKWELMNVPLEDGEYVKQMVDHNYYYFISNHGRVFSLKYKGWMERKQYTTESKNVKSIRNKRLHVYLSLKNGKKKHCKVSRLVAHYFEEVSAFNPMKEETLDAHHIQPYEPEKGRMNNYAENIQMVGNKVHKELITSLGNAPVTENGTTDEYAEKMFQKLLKLDTEDALMLVREIDADTMKGISARGIMLTPEQEEALLQGIMYHKVKNHPEQCTGEEIRALLDWSKKMEEVGNE